MKRVLIAFAVLSALSIWGADCCSAQSIDDLNLQVHGYATQGFIYTTHNNWNTTDSTSGSSAWTEAVINMTAQPQPKLRIGMQARYYLLGNYGNEISLDWAQADYKLNEKFGFRVGKVKSPTSLLNEVQDIDPAFPWILLPQGIYPESSRNSILAHYGGVMYGTLPLGRRGGKLEYRVFGGERIIEHDDGYLQPYSELGLTAPDGLTGTFHGGTLRWNTPIHGLMLGINESSETLSGKAIYNNTYPGNASFSPMNPNFFFGQYERKKAMLAAEYGRTATRATVTFPGVMTYPISLDVRAFYAMTSYKLTQKLTGGIYYSSSIDRQAAFNSNRYQKDWALSSRYDFSPFLYLKLEQHFIDGTEWGFSALSNSNVKPNTRMTMLKMGVSF